mgnify:CR=1 FL=1
MKTKQNTDTKEIEKFSKLSSKWWDETGPFKALHKLTIPRLQFITKHLTSSFSGKKKNIKLLDVGCGGGLLCEPLSRQGYNIAGIDASLQAIDAAKEHAKNMGLSINYQHESLPDFKKTGHKVDVIFLLEILEHVPNPKSLIHTTLDCLNPNGLLFFSTLNRTLKAHLLGIHVAEKILKWAPKGAHSYKKFLKPSEIQHSLEEKNYTITDIQGISFNILKNHWELSKDLSINYIGVAKNQE